MTYFKHNWKAVDQKRSGTRRCSSKRGASFKLRGAPAILLCLMLLILLLPESAFACPTCKQALANGHDGVSLGYYWSILFMMAMPFLIFASWAFFIWRALRKQPHAILQSVLES